jgi:hypothetical protein
VDHEGKSVDDIPLTRKVPLPHPRTAGTENAWFGSPSEPVERGSLTPREERVLRMRFGLGMDVESLPEDARREFSATRDRIREIEAKAQRKLRHPGRSRKLRSFLEFDSAQAPTLKSFVSVRAHAPSEWPATVPEEWEALEAAFANFDWDAAPNLVVEGDLSAVEPRVARMILRQATRDAAIVIALRLGLDPILLIIGRFAIAAAEGSRAAARIGRTIFRKIDPNAVARALSELDGKLAQTDKTNV